MMPGSKRGSRGLMLIELMIAMLIGLFLIGGAIAVFIASKRSYTETEAFSRMGESGRFALQLLITDLRRAGFFGEVGAAGIERSASLDAVAGGTDCTGRAAAYDIDNFVFVARADGSGRAVGCVTDAVPGTDVLVVKSVRTQPLSDGVRDDPSDDDGSIDTPHAPSAQQVYVMANSVKGTLFDGADTAPSITVGGEVPGGNAWEYEFQAYYVRAGAVPQLSRKLLRWNGAGMAVATEDVVEGVESLRVMLGIDSNADGEADSYVDSQAAGIDWSGVASMQLFLLVRSVERDPQYTDQRTYTLGNGSVTPGGNFHRTVMRDDVSLRNSKLLMRGGR